MCIPPDIQPLLDEYVLHMEQRLPDLMSAFYLHGSIALGAFDPQQSDIDFVTVINRPCTPRDTNALTDIHHRLRQKYPQWKMDGCYLQWDDLHKAPHAIEPHLHVNDGLHASGHASGGWVTWWLLKHHGVTVVGIDPKTLDITINWNAFMADMHDNVNSYLTRFIRDPRRMVWLWFDYGIQWTVLGVLRQFYTLREHDIISKVGAGEYGLRNLPQRWHRIVHEAIRIRQQKPISLYRLRLQRTIDAWQFLRHVIRVFE